MGVNGWTMLELEWIRQIETCPKNSSLRFFQELSPKHQVLSPVAIPFRPERLILGELESRLHLDVKVLLSPGSPERKGELWWFLMVYDGLWWFMMVFDGFWWFTKVYDGLWWFMMVYDGFWWFMMVYDGFWWFTMVYDGL